MTVILVSACLLGRNCRYNGTSCKNDAVTALGRQHTLIPVCPETDGGLPTPRCPSERVSDKVFMKDGTDVTDAFAKGAAAALSTARKNHAAFAIFKSLSPSCGKGRIYDGSFSGRTICASGVTAQLLEAHGIPVYTETDEWPL